MEWRRSRSRKSRPASSSPSLSSSTADTSYFALFSSFAHSLRHTVSNETIIAFCLWVAARERARPTPPPNEIEAARAHARAAARPPGPGWRLEGGRAFVLPDRVALRVRERQKSRNSAFTLNKRKKNGTVRTRGAAAKKERASQPDSLRQAGQQLGIVYYLRLLKILFTHTVKLLP